MSRLLLTLALFAGKGALILIFNGDKGHFEGGDES